MSTPITRRFFLRGAAGAALAIPVLPSLLSASEARAQANAPRAMVMYATHHGDIWPERMFPVMPNDAETRAYGGRTIRRAPLALTVNGGDASLAPVLTAPSTRFTSRLVTKMNVVNGLDIPFYIAHHTGGYLGNFARNDGNGGDGSLAQQNCVRRTVDQILGWSPSFYPDLSGVRERVIVLGPRLSYNYSNPGAQTGPIQEVAVSANRPVDLFDELFPSTGGPAARPPIVDQVREAYRRLATSPRLSGADRRRLDDHVERVAELQRKLAASAGAACGVPVRPTAPMATRRASDLQYTRPYSLDPESHAGYYQVMNEVLALAMACGLSRVAVVNTEATFSTYAGDWHQDVAHQTTNVDAVRQGTMAESKQSFFANTFLDLAERFDSVDMGDGTTLLDRSLCWWTQEHGGTTHGSQGMPVVTFGGAGGSILTGSNIDYRNLNACFDPNVPAGVRLYAGLLWQQWLGTVLQSMGVPRSEWENAAENGGYPDWRFAHVQWNAIDERVAYPDATWNVAGELLPYLGA